MRKNGQGFLEKMCLTNRQMKNDIPIRASWIKDLFNGQKEPSGKLIFKRLLLDSVAGSVGSY